jgi:hypothetical protein
MSAKGESGMDINLDRVPTRQEGMRPWEILLSESQERMLVVVKKGREAEVKAIFDKWDLHCVDIGTVTEGDQVRFFWHGELVADVPAESLVLGGGAPVYTREEREPAYIKENNGTDVVVAMPVGGNPNRIGWSASYESLGEMEGKMAKLMADPKYMEMGAKGSENFIAGSWGDEIWRTI